jgi:hypothetical protein
MKKTYIVIIGLYDENTTEQIALKEIGVQAKDALEAHKIAFLKCNLTTKETVLKVLDSNKVVCFDHLKGFTS